MKTDNPLLIRFFERRRDKIKLVAATFTVALVIAAIITSVHGKLSSAGPNILAFLLGLVPSILIFPSGLLWLLVTRITESPGYEGGGIVMVFMYLFFSFLGWILYFGLISIFLATKPRTALILYVLLIIFLVTNLAGCNILLSDF
jgi:hypothetical protein